jgi:hypothetical protein
MLETSGGWRLTHNAHRLGVSNGDGARRGLITIVELIDPRPYIFQVTMYSNLIYTVIYVMGDRLFINPSKSKSPFDSPTRSA